MKKNSFRPLDVLRAVCPQCRSGQVTNGPFIIRKRCLNCDYNFYPEPGFYLGAMMVSFLATAMMMVPTIIALKFADVRPETLAITPILIFFVLGPFLIHYSKVLWLHLEYSITDRLDGHSK